MEWNHRYSPKITVEILRLNMKLLNASVTKLCVCVCVCVWKLRCEGGKVSCQPYMERERVSVCVFVFVFVCFIIIVSCPGYKKHFCVRGSWLSLVPRPLRRPDTHCVRMLYFPSKHW